MKRTILIALFSLISMSAFSQTPKISIKGLEVGMDRNNVTGLIGAHRSLVRGFTVAGATGDLLLRYKDEKLESAYFRFSNLFFETIKDAYSEKYKSTKCENSVVQNAMGAKYEQVVCTYQDEQAVLTISRYTDINFSSLHFTSLDAIKREAELEKQKKKDI